MGSSYKIMTNEYLHMSCSSTNPASSQYFKVYIRLRPNAPESPSTPTSPFRSDGQTLFIQSNTHQRKQRRYQFNRVFPQQSNNQHIFESTKDQISTCLHGYNLTLMAYGVTGSGKTHTIFGNQREEGLAIRYCRQLFEGKDVTEVRFSYMEIYNENVRDLLADGAKPLTVLEDNGRTLVPELGEFVVRDAQQVAEMIRQGNQRRVRGVTNINEASSRSHAILQFSITVKKGEEVLQSKLNVIDLAGSQRVFHNESDKMVLQGSNINRSLLALGNCITALSQRKTSSHIPYRDSKLTRILKQTLSGNSRSLMFACISSSPSQYEQTLSTIHYASRASRIRKRLTRNVKDSEIMCPKCCHTFDLPKQAAKALKPGLQEVDFKELKDRMNSMIEQALLIGRHNTQDGVYDVSILENVFESNREVVFGKIEQLAEIQQNGGKPKSLHHTRQHAQTSPAHVSSHKKLFRTSQPLPLSPQKQNTRLHINLKDMQRRNSNGNSNNTHNNNNNSLLQHRNNELPYFFSRRTSRQDSGLSEETNYTPTLRMKRDSLQEGGSPSQGSPEAEFPVTRYRSARLSLVQHPQNRKLRLM